MIEESVLEEAVELTEDEDVTASEYIEQGIDESDIENVSCFSISFFGEYKLDKALCLLTNIFPTKLLKLRI